MNIRKIIREQINIIFEEENTSLFGDALSNIGTEIDTDVNNIGAIINTHKTDINNMDNQIKTNIQLKSKLNSKNPQKKGLEAQIPEMQKDYEARKKQLKDLENARLGLQSAKSEIEKQKIEMEKQANLPSNGEKTKSVSVLPTLQSPI